MYVVIGATGNVGRAVVQQLAARGHEVRAVSRDPGRVHWPAGVTPHAADLQDPAAVAAALVGAQGVFTLSGYAGVDEALAGVGDADVPHVALLSSSSIPGSGPNAVRAYHEHSEQAVRASGAAGWTFLRPAAFMSNALRWAPAVRAGEVVPEPFPDAAAAVVDPADIAAVAVGSLLAGRDGERVHRITGPTALRPAERAAILTRELGVPVHLEPVPAARVEEHLAAQMPAPYVEAFLDFYLAGSLDESVVTDTVQEVTGRPPVTFDEWVRANAAAFLRG